MSDVGREAAGTRVESDSLGEIQVDGTRYWGAQTERARANFAIGDRGFDRRFLRCYGLLKRVAAESNRELGELTEPIAGWIAAAADELARGDFDDEFPLQVWQSGSGTQTHMNVNEVVAGRANELAGRPRGGKSPVHPNDHVNRGQSTNDTFPTVMHVACAIELNEALLPALDRLHARLRERSAAFGDVMKIGRTHLQDATPLTLGQEIGAWATQVGLAREPIVASLSRIRRLAIGGTAVGTGLNAHPRLGERIASRLGEETGIAFEVAPDRFAALAGHEPLVELSGGLNTLACALLKLANDVRWLSSGPRCGLGELSIPANEPGSSIMPGKINPTQAEALAMVCSRVFGNHVTVTMAAGQGNLQLNVQKPVLIHALLESLVLLADAMTSFEIHCLRGLEPRLDRVAEHVEQSLMRVTALAPHIGYDAAARIAKDAHDRGVTLRAAALDSGLVTEAQFDEWTAADRLLGRSTAGSETR